MADQIRFEDGAVYERMMGVWSRIVGNDFLDWLALPEGLKWLDVGCGNGAFTELLAGRAPAEVQAIDPSEGQLAYARTRPGAKKAEFLLGDAMALPFGDGRFDAAAMALVIFFVPEPEKGVAEMARVVRPGGTVAAYAWDIPGGGLPMEALLDQIRAMGKTPLLPPHPEVSSVNALRKLWTDTGLSDVETCRLEAERTFADFEDYWFSTTASQNLTDRIATMPVAEAERLKEGTRSRLAAGPDGRITVAAWANAVKGRVA